MPLCPVQTLKNGQPGYMNPLICIECGHEQRGGVDLWIRFPSLISVVYLPGVASALAITTALVPTPDTGSMLGLYFSTMKAMECSYLYDNHRPYYTDKYEFVYHPSGKPRIIAVKCAFANRIERIHQNRAGFMFLVQEVEGSRVWKEEGRWIFAEAEGKPLQPEDSRPNDKLKSTMDLMMHSLRSSSSSAILFEHDDTHSLQNVPHTSLISTIFCEAPRPSISTPCTGPIPPSRAVSPSHRYLIQLPSTPSSMRSTSKHRTLARVVSSLVSRDMVVDGAGGSGRSAFGLVKRMCPVSHEDGYVRSSPPRVSVLAANGSAIASVHPTIGWHSLTLLQPGSGGDYRGEAGCRSIHALETALCYAIPHVVDRHGKTIVPRKLRTYRGVTLSVWPRCASQPGPQSGETPAAKSALVSVAWIQLEPQPKPVP
ncbi:hypothetical protein CALCODRAFT_506247 [Calocera cornea HHB12733]|uniref:Uncharacterized protein n=1 Tax=Calocera cornea HHB12733 TaxID=1353952 RepID=A0A165J7K2_9BASI|nr:hypothetical protein CALCODRAFT_506247 [Calocera cornea HHB12733]